MLVFFVVIFSVLIFVFGRYVFVTVLLLLSLDTSKYYVQLCIQTTLYSLIHMLNNCRLMLPNDIDVREQKTISFCAFGCCC